MKTITKNYLIFVTICILLLVYFYFVEYFYTICFYDTFYITSYFFFVLLAFIIGTVFYLIKILMMKLRKKVDQSPDEYFLKYLLFILAPNSYFKMERTNWNYLIFATICILLMVYFSVFGYSYIILEPNLIYYAINYSYFILPVFIIGTIFYLVSKKMKKNRISHS